MLGVNHIVIEKTMSLANCCLVMIIAMTVIHLLIERLKFDPFRFFSK